ncbi:hypothetical protein [Microbacterium oxydans]|uniref:hypothetical protein n=1 Tax=Microbacterium oxydans TaxID=82380 RepID=UPI0022B1613E|nr:hypothetical protein [Microbacterium oxydans]MCZ4301339.1 hypothetical protein [Microbacterium oxydans]
MSRRTVRANYPGKKRLTETEMDRVLRDGPPLEWFEPWAERGVMLARMTSHGYGYFHVYSEDGSFQYDFAAWPTEEGLRWGMERLHKEHTDCQGCRGVMYFTPDQPPRLHIVVEQDEEDTEAGE